MLATAAISKKASMIAKARDHSRRRLHVRRAASTLRVLSVAT
jgi:hypothetical protein